MRRDKYKAQVASLLGTQSVLRFALGAMVIVTLGMLYALIQMAGTTKTVVVPPNIEDPFWVTQEQIDPEYVETLGSFLVSLSYNVTPSSVEYQTKKLLKWVHPKVHGELETEMARLAKRIQRENVSMYFSPSRILTDTGGDGIPSVAVVGEVTRKVGSTETRREQIAVVMRFTIAAGKVYLTAFYEADDTSNPFGKK